MSNEMHVFEAAGLGKAPYKYLGVEVLRGPITVQSVNGCVVQIGAPGQPMGCCQYCSTGIAYLFWLESTDGRKFYVGSDCIYKSGDVGLKRIIEPIVAQHNKEIRDSRANLLLDMFKKQQSADPTFPASFHITDKPHPNFYYARQGKTLGDYNMWAFMHTGFLGRSRMARKFLLDAGVALPDNKRKRGHRPEGFVPVEYTIPGLFGGVRIIDLGD